MLVPLLVMYVPAVQLGLVQPAQKLALVREENFPASQGAQVLSLVADPFAATKLHSSTHGDITPSPCPSSAKTCDGATHVVCFEIDLVYADFVTLSS